MVAEVAAKLRDAGAVVVAKLSVKLEVSVRQQQRQLQQDAAGVIN